MQQLSLWELLQDFESYLPPQLGVRGEAGSNMHFLYGEVSHETYRKIAKDVIHKYIGLLGDVLDFPVYVFGALSDVRNGKQFNSQIILWCNPYTDVLETPLLKGWQFNVDDYIDQIQALAHYNGTNAYINHTPSDDAAAYDWYLNEDKKTKKALPKNRTAPPLAYLRESPFSERDFFALMEAEILGCCVEATGAQVIYGPSYMYLLNDEVFDAPVLIKGYPAYLKKQIIRNIGTPTHVFDENDSRQYSTDFTKISFSGEQRIVDAGYGMAVVSDTVGVKRPYYHFKWIR